MLCHSWTTFILEANITLAKVQRFMLSGQPNKRTCSYVYPYGHSGAFFCRADILRMKLHTYLYKTCTAVHRPYHLLCPILGCGIAPNKRAGLLWCFRLSAVHPDLPKNRFHIIIQRYAGSLNRISYHAPRIEPIITEFTTYKLDFLTSTAHRTQDYRIHQLGLCLKPQLIEVSLRYNYISWS